MSGLKLQVLSNPGLGSSPSFQIGNPQRKTQKKAIAKPGRKRENKGMSKRRRKNPFTSFFANGKKKASVGPFHNASELARDKKLWDAASQTAQRLGEKQAKSTLTALEERLLANSIATSLAMAKQYRAASAHSQKAFAQMKKLKASGWKMLRSEKLKRAKGHKTKKTGMAALQSLENQIKSGQFEKLLKAKAASLKKHKKKPSKKAASKKPKKKPSKKATSKTAKKARAKKGGKGRRTSGKGLLFGGWRITGREGNFVIRTGPNGQIKKSKIKPRGRAKPKKNPKRRKASRRGNKSRKRRTKRNPMRHKKSRKSHRKAHGNRRKNRGNRGNRKNRKHRKNPFWRNPMGVDLKKIALAGHRPSELGYLAVAAGASGGLNSLVAAALDKVSGGAFSSFVISQGTGPMANLASAIPAIFGALAIGAAGQKFKSDKAEKAAEALMTVAIVDLSEALLGGPLNSLIAPYIPAQTAVAMSGVTYTPLGRKRRPMGAVPRGLSAVPRGLGSYLPSPGGTLSTDADFGAVPRGLSGLTFRDHADFGASRQAADFGGVDYTMSGVGFTANHMGAIPSMRGAHTGDVMYPDPTTDANGNEDDTNESNDHTV